MVGLLHAMAFMVLLLIGWVIWNNKPLPLPLYRHHELLCKSSSIQPNSFAVVVHLTPRTNTQNKRKPASYRKAPSSSCNRFL